MLRIKRSVMRFLRLGTICGGDILKDYFVTYVCVS